MQYGGAIIIERQLMAERIADMDKTSEETREERFKRVATRRTNNVLRQIRILGNCSNKSSYSYTEEEIQKIFFSFLTNS